MYGPKWPFLLMYESHDMRHTGFPRVNGLSTKPPGFGASQSRSTMSSLVDPMTRDNLETNIISYDRNLIIMIPS